MSARRTRRVCRSAAGALAVVALAAPTAAARPAIESTADARAAQPPGPTITRIVDGGFEWASAAIGAGGAAVVLLVSAAGATTVSRRHHRAGAIH